MTIVSEQIAAKAIATEFTLRLRKAVDDSRMAKADLEDPKRSCKLDDEERQLLLDSVRRAEKMALRGFKFDLLCDLQRDDNPERAVKGIWIAAEAIIIKQELDGLSFPCRTVPDCDCERLCAMNNIIDRKIEDGYRPSFPVTKRHPIPYSAMADGCPRITGPRVYTEDDLATGSRWTGDTASLKARG